MEDRRCKLGLAGRLQLVRLLRGDARCGRQRLRVLFRRPPRIGGGIAGGWRLRLSGSRWRVCGPAPRGRSPAPGHLSAEAERRILHARESTSYGPASLAGLVGICRGTI